MISRRYIAGFFDGEGCIYVYKKGRYINIRVTISQVDRTPLDLIAEQFGGSVHRLYETKGTHKTCYQWTAACKTARDFLESIVPWLIVKKEQAKKAIYLGRVLSENRGSHVDGLCGSLVSKKEWEMREQLMAVCKDKTKKMSDMIHPGVAELMAVHRALAKYELMQ